MEKDHLQKLFEDEELGEKLTPKQAKILEAAIEMFAEKGYASTSTSEIAKKAGVAEGTIFRHYKTKKDLLLGILTPLMSRFAYPFFMHQFVQSVFKEMPETYEQLLWKLMRNRYDFARKNSALIKILLQELAFHPELKEEFQEVFTTRVYPKFREAIEHYKARGQLVDIPTETVFRLTVTNLLGFVLTRFVIFPELEWDDEAEIKHTIDFLAKGLRP